MKLRDLSGPALEEADELLGVATHDLAKYMALTARNVRPEAIPADLEARLVEELVRVDGSRPAWELWDELAADLARLADDPELGAISAAMGRLRAMAAEDRVDHPALARLVVSTADRIRALRTALRSLRLEGAG